MKINTQLYQKNKIVELIFNKRREEVSKPSKAIYLSNQEPTDPLRASDLLAMFFRFDPQSRQFFSVVSSLMVICLPMLITISCVDIL